MVILCLRYKTSSKRFEYSLWSVSNITPSKQKDPKLAKGEHVWKRHRCTYLWAGAEEKYELSRREAHTALEDDKGVLLSMLPTISPGLHRLSRKKLNLWRCHHHPPLPAQACTPWMSLPVESQRGKKPMAPLGWVSRCDTASRSGDSSSATQGLGTVSPVHTRTATRAAAVAQTPAEHKAYFYIFTAILWIQWSHQ